MLRTRRFVVALFTVLLFAASSVTAAPEYVTVDILDWVNNDGISWITYPADGDVDGVGYAIPAEQLPEGDFTLKWDDTTEVPFLGFYMEDGWGNNIEAWGDTIDVPQGNYTALWLLVVAHHGPVEAPLFVNYTDGTRAEFLIQAGDWCGNPVAGEKMLLRPAYRHNANGIAGPSCGFWLLPPFQLDPQKTVASITLPDEERLHVFGITLEK